MNDKQPSNDNENKPSIPERMHNFYERMIGVKRRVDPTKVDGPVYSTFNDRMFACVLDTAIIFFLFRDIFDWMTAFLFQGMETNFDIPPDSPLAYASNEEQIRYIVDQLFSTGFAQIWLINSFFQSLLVGITLVIVWSYYHTTPGKWLLGLEYADEKTLTPPTLAQYIKRYAGFYLSMTPLMIGFAFLGFTKKKQAWHDKIAGTVVVYNKEGHILKRLYRYLKEQWKKGS
ncbi:MAG: RDD family protein [Rickettsiales bacterium]|nr:RDD family protein [Rickettsiales bacterium]